MTTTPRRRNLVDEAITTDATEFGLHMKQGGWRLGLLVARNVKIAPGRVAPETLLPKVNATEFARRAGTSNDRVIRHYAAWQRAAAAGLVPDADTLNPATQVDLDVERLPAWGPIYNAPIERRTATTRAARPPVGPVTTRTADTVMPPTAPLRETPDTDDAQVSRELEAARVRMDDALAQVRDPDHDAEVAATARDSEWTDDVRYAINAMMGHARRLADAARDPEWVNPDARERASLDLVELSKQLGMIAELSLNRTVTDEALASLLNT